MLYPLLFHPIFKERVWGGRNLERLFSKRLPGDQPIGESWEISDRPGDVSVIANGALAGRDLHWLLENQREALLGAMAEPVDRFPLLIKILDAQQDLSLQVHPPADTAKELGGEPKTEMWYSVQAQPGAAFYAGIKRGISREVFENKLDDGTVAECFHRLPVKQGDSLFLPSGRVHAIGAGNVLFEIQQNSDTTYRVFDWNRAGLDGKPRELHVQQSLASIDFNDFEPGLSAGDFVTEGSCRRRTLADDPLFRVEVRQLEGGSSWQMPPGEMSIIAQITGHTEVSSSTGGAALEPGGFCLVPASLLETEVKASTAAEFLDIRMGNQYSG